MTVGTEALFQHSNVMPHTEHSKLFTSREGDINWCGGGLRQPARAVTIIRLTYACSLAYANYCGEKAERRDRGALSVRGATSNFATL